MDRQDGAKAVPRGRHTLEAAVRVERLADPLRAVRDLVGGDLLAEDRLVGDVVAQVDVRIDNPHRAILATAIGAEGEDGGGHVVRSVAHEVVADVREGVHRDRPRPAVTRAAETSASAAAREPTSSSAAISAVIGA